MERKLLVLDLDETLVSTRLLTGLCKQDPSRYYYRDIYGYYEITLRPGFHHFLVEASKLYDIGLWSASDSQYINYIVSLFPKHIVPVFVFDENRCVKKCPV